jgi:hypothetical protein
MAWANCGRLDRVLLELLLQDRPIVQGGVLEDLEGLAALLAVLHPHLSCATTQLD